MSLSWINTQMVNHPIFKIAFLGLSIVLLSQKLQAQHDSTYYNSYVNQITSRFYFSQKYTSLNIKDSKNTVELDYRPNTTLNMGVGASYQWFTLNLAYGFKFLNQEEDRGETEYLDLQAHFYGQKENIDLYAQFYDGFYLSPRGYASNNKELFYLRPDLKIREFGASYQHVFNNKKFSTRAALIQNEWQKKSAGSFLLGGELFFGKATADSSVYPTLIKTDSLPGVNKMTFIEFGPSFGYGYTLVIARHFYISAILTANADYNLTKYEGPDYEKSFSGFTPNSMLRAFAGYNSERNALSLSFLNSRVALSSDENNKVSINTGNIRINYIHRFIPGPKTLKFLKKFDWFFNIKKKRSAVNG